MKKSELLQIIARQEQELAAQREQLALLREQLKFANQRAEALAQENVLLRQRVDLLVRRIFGPGSEKIDPAQLDLFNPDLEPLPPGKCDASWVEPIQEASSSRQAKTRPRRDWPQDLPVVEEVIDPPEVLTAPEAWRCIGAEINEQLDYEPARFLRRRMVRRKYVSRVDPDRGPSIAALPPLLLERGALAPGLLAHVIVSKFVDHLPLFRQEQIYRQRHHIQLPRQSLARWMDIAADWLQLIYQQIRDDVLAGGYVQIDETPVRYLAPGHGQTKQGYFWAASRPGGDVFFQWQTTRAATCLQAMLPEHWKGTIQCDGYSAYASYARGRPDLKLAACWAHARRKFYEARDQDPRRAGWILRQIGHLYAIERRLRRQRAGTSLRAATRAHEAAPILARLHRVFTRWKTNSRFLPRSGLGVALDYILYHWSQLGVYIADGRLEIDSNLVENAIRPTAIGKKNWLFVGAAETGQRSAILYTIVECCRRRGINPYEYLRAILTRLPSSTNHQVKDLTPQAWQKASRLALAA